MFDEQINESLRDGVISRSDSPFASCLHVVLKKSGKQSVCVDYRRLNAISLLEAYLIPPLYSLLDNLYGNRLFSVINLKSAYHNVPIRPEDRHKTVFITKSGCYEFDYMPFGLNSASATFMCFVHEISYSTNPELKNHTEVYLDDILIHTKGLESHEAVFDQICHNLGSCNLAINLHKFIFARENLIILVLKYVLMVILKRIKRSRLLLSTPFRKHLEVFLVFVVQLIFITKLLKSVVNYYDRCKTQTKSDQKARLFNGRISKNLF